MSLSAWIIFAIVFLVLLGLDLFSHRKAHEVKMKEALMWTAIWVGAAMLFNGYVFLTMGKTAGINFLTGYLIEETLSIDNLFVFLLIFKYFRTPSTSLHKVLFWGILGAIFFRGLFIVLGLVVIEKFHAIIYLFGLFLIFTGIRFSIQKEKEIHPENNPIIRFFRRLFPMTENYVDDHFWIRKNKSIYFTPLFLVLLSIETTDIIFAVDSVPAILAITYDPFIVFTSNIFAILGLRSLYFLLSHSLEMFRLLHYGISLILIFVGFKMVVSDFWPISPLVSLSVIVFILLMTILASILIKKEERPKGS